MLLNKGFIQFFSYQKTDMKYLILKSSAFWYLPYSLVAQAVTSLPALWETWIQSLGQEDPLEKEMATHFGILAWEIPWTEEPGRLQSTGSQRVGYN